MSPLPAFQLPEAAKGGCACATAVASWAAGAAAEAAGVATEDPGKPGGAFVSEAESSGLDSFA